MKKGFPGKGWIIAGAICIGFGIMAAGMGYFDNDGTIVSYDEDYGVSASEASEYVGMGLGISTAGVICMIVGVIIHFAHRKFSDTDGDGIANDGLPATPAQRKEIAQIMQNKGIFFNAESEKLMQGEARRIIRENSVNNSAQNLANSQISQNSANSQEKKS